PIRTIQAGGSSGCSVGASPRSSGRTPPATTATARTAWFRAARAGRPGAARSPFRSPDAAAGGAGTVAAVEAISILAPDDVEAVDLSEHSRHLEMDYSILRWSDKPYVCYGTSGPKARDAVELAAIARGGRDRIERTPAIMGVVNPNSPLVWDFLMVDALAEW